MTIEKRAAFLEWLACSCNVSYAARQIGVSREALYQLRRRDENFARDWDLAKEIGLAGLENEMRRRAFIGDVRQTKYGERRIYSDRLAIFLAKAHRPNKYCDRYQHHLATRKQSVTPHDLASLPDLNRVINNALAQAIERKRIRSTMEV